MMNEDDSRFVFLPLEEAQTASGRCHVYRDHWWIMHPEKGLVFFQPDKRKEGSLEGAAPQCNANKNVIEHVRDKNYPWASTVRLPLVIVAIDPRDYC